MCYSLFNFGVHTNNLDSNGVLKNEYPLSLSLYFYIYKRFTFSVMAEIVTFQSIENPLEKLVTDAGKNAADILCPKETCKCVVFRKNTASLVERDGAKVIVSPRQWQGC